MNILLKKFVGNEILIDSLIDNFNNNNLSKSLIFAGPKGIGKTTLAFYIIKKIYKICTKNISLDHHLKLITNNSHPNIKYIKKEFDEKTKRLKKNINIDQIRSFENFIHQSSFNNLPKFILIDSADDLNTSSSNAILKNLEESKNNTYFLLISHQISSILPTIRSRCNKLFIKKPNKDEFVKIINLYSDIQDTDKINFLYYLTNGSPGIALEIISDNIDSLNDIIIEILYNNEPLSSSVINLANTVSSYTTDKFKIFLMLLRFILITITKIKLGLNIQNQLSFNLYENLSKLSYQISNAKIIEILEYLNINEKDLFVYNLDKKIFSLNIFSNLKDSYE